MNLRLIRRIIEDIARLIRDEMQHRLRSLHHSLADWIGQRRRNRDTPDTPGSLITSDDWGHLPSSVKDSVWDVVSSVLPDTDPAQLISVLFVGGDLWAIEVLTFQDGCPQIKDGEVVTGWIYPQFDPEHVALLIGS